MASTDGDSNLNVIPMDSDENTKEGMCEKEKDCITFEHNQESKQQESSESVVLEKDINKSNEPMMEANEATEVVEESQEMIQFKVIFNKKKLDIVFPLDGKVSALREHLEKETGVPCAMQKLMFKGKMQDDKSLREHNLVKNSKVMLVGSTVTDVMSVTAPDPKALKEEIKQEEASGKVSLSKTKPHVTILEKYKKPDDVMIGIKNKKERLPPVPISGMYNKSGGKVRLTFKLENDQLWIGTKQRTEKVPMGSIKAVVSEPLVGHEEYHMMAFQLGPTEASRYWVYWVPAQYVDAIKDAVLGKFQFF